MPVVSLGVRLIASSCVAVQCRALTEGAGQRVEQAPTQRLPDHHHVSLLTAYSSSNLTALA